jgi:hypothetical protein
MFSYDSAKHHQARVTTDSIVCREVEPGVLCVAYQMCYTVRRHSPLLGRAAAESFAAHTRTSISGSGSSSGGSSTSGDGASLLRFIYQDCLFPPEHHQDSSITAVTQVRSAIRKT